MINKGAQRTRRNTTNTTLCSLCFVVLFVFVNISTHAENGYDLWLRYKPITNTHLLTTYKQQLTEIIFNDNSPTLKVAKEELQSGLAGLLQTTIPFSSTITRNGSLWIGPASSLPTSNKLQDQLNKAGKEGYIIVSSDINGKKTIIITANSDVGVLYGVFNFLRLIQIQQSITPISIVTAPKLQLRLLDHWDNLNRTIERGYAGFSLWNWHTLPDYLDKRYTDYARANASIGINGTVLTNVNANATILTTHYLKKVAALANVFRPYGIKVYLTARFSSPIEIGGLKTADPLDPSVQKWWKDKIDEIYSLIPDFGGFLIKANSEGQPGPQNYNRTHADGANMFADALLPHNGIVMWRAFVYSNETPEDRHKQAYNEFKPLDGQFRKNVLIQVKNGAIDFQPREPFHPLFGAMPKTPLMMEFQLTQEYLGQGTHLVYLAPLFKECLESDTYSNGKGSTVGKVIDGSIDHYSLTGMAGVANTGTDIDWCSHPFAQANWYALGRLAWNHDLSADEIADEWLRMTFTNDIDFVKSASLIMLSSRETLVKYMTPLGLHHIMATGHHYGPGPWVNNLSRADWNPVYYHKADSAGIGFDRTSKGSNALGQYAVEVQKEWNDINCPDKYLLWFHHIPWNYTMRSGRNLWNELCYQYNEGVNGVKEMEHTWNSIKNKIDKERAEQVTMLLHIQENEAMWWRNACLLYFQTFSKMPFPANFEQPDHTLDYYKKLQFPDAN